MGAEVEMRDGNEIKKGMEWGGSLAAGAEFVL